MQDTRFSRRANRKRWELSKSVAIFQTQQRVQNLRLGLAHNLVTPNESVTMRFVCPHGRDVDDIAARDETQGEDATDEELGSS